MLPSAGSAENVRRLRYEPGVKLAIVQSDVYQAYLDIANNGNREAGDNHPPLRVIMPLYNEEIYFVVRADSKLNFVHEIYNARINAGEMGSGTALTTSTLYRLMFGEALPEAHTTFLSNENALLKLTDDKTVDVVAIVAGQPAKLLADMKPEARQFIKLLKVDHSHPSTKAVLQDLFSGDGARGELSQPPDRGRSRVCGARRFSSPTTTTSRDTKKSLARLAESLCENFPKLTAKGHPKWKEVELALPELGRGWFYYRPTMDQLRSCIRSNVAKVDRAPKHACTQSERILGLCS